MGFTGNQLLQACKQDLILSVLESKNSHGLDVQLTILTRFQSDLEKLKSIFLSNGYLERIHDRAFNQSEKDKPVGQSIKSIILSKYFFSKNYPPTSFFIKLCLQI